MGTLQNGFRYYVRSNAEPTSRARLWLAVNAGSVLEDEDQRGYAHFLKHVAFNGTQRFSGQEVIDSGEASAMRSYAELIAYTSMDGTVYMQTVPTDDSISIKDDIHH